MLLVIAMTMGISTFAQDRTYKEGSVWNVQFIRTNAGMGVEYLNSLKTTWKATQDEALKQGLILSYKILDGQAANPQDFDIILLTEFKNLASMEGMDDKWDAISKKVVGDQAAMKTLRDSRQPDRT